MPHSAEGGPELITVQDSHQFTYRHNRPENQDAFFIMTGSARPDGSGQIVIQAVLDGISSANGKASSGFALDAAYKSLGSLLARSRDLAGMDEDRRYALILGAMKDAVRRSDAALRTRPGDNGSTISIAVVFGGYVYTCNIGDSPIYLLKDSEDNPSLTELFFSHNEAAIQVREGKMTRDEAVYSPSKNHLCRALGDARRIREDEIPFFREPLGASNILLLGSDGALSVVPPSRLQELTTRAVSMQNLVEQVYEDVQDSDSDDNFTMLATRILVS